MSRFLAWATPAVFEFVVCFAGITVHVLLHMCKSCHLWFIIANVRNKKNHSGAKEMKRMKKKYIAQKSCGNWQQAVFIKWSTNIYTCCSFCFCKKKNYNTICSLEWRKRAHCTQTANFLPWLHAYQPSRLKHTHVNVCDNNASPLNIRNIHPKKITATKWERTMRGRGRRENTTNAYKQITST